jgi:epsilon-lactone hydrolase
MSLRSVLLRPLLRVVLVTQFPPDMPIEKQRAMTEGSVKRFFRPPRGITVTSVAVGSVRGDWLAPIGLGKNAPVILYLHGGGYTTGSPLTHRDLVGRLALAAGVQALVLDYRLAPEHPFPAALDDSVAAYKYLLGEGIKPAQIVIAGDSAGGGLTLTTLISLRDSGLPLPAAGVCISPMTDLAFTGESGTANAKLDPVIQVETLRSHSARYLAGQDPRLPLASPLYADLHGLPPLLIQAGSYEVLLDDAIRLAERARAQGVSVTLSIAPGMWHVWHVYAALIPEAKWAIQEIAVFLKQRLTA